MDRNKISSKYKIDLSTVYASEKEFNLELVAIDKLIDKVKKYKNHVLDSSDKFYEVLKFDSEISFYLEKLYVYAHINNDINLNDSKWNKNYGKVISLYAKYGSVASFLIPEILSKDLKVIKNYILENPKLKIYEYNLKCIFKSKKHILSDREENIVNQFSKTFKCLPDAINKLLNIDCKFEIIEDKFVTNGTFEEFLFSKNKDVRRDAFDKFYGSLESINLTMSTLIGGIVENNNVSSSLRKYSSYLDMSLSKNDIDVKIYDNLIKNVSKKLACFDKYWLLKKKTLNLKKLNLFDLNVRSYEFLDKKYTFDEARDIVQSALLIFGKDYSDVVNKMFSEGWIDVYPSNGKKEVSYTTCSYNTHPYIFLNYKDNYKDISTLIHEIGHAMHFYYSKNNNGFETYGNSIFVAEVASQVNEIFLNKYMLNKAKSREEKLALLEDKLVDFEFTIRKSTLSAEFEKNIHEYSSKCNIITNEYLNNEYLKLIKKYYGNNIIIDDKIKYDWMRLSSMYGKFYVYQYATGYVAAMQIAEAIWNKEENAFENYIKFLSMGSTNDPVSLLKVAGVDMTGNKMYNNAFKIFENTLNAYEEIYSSKEETINE